MKKYLALVLFMMFSPVTVARAEGPAPLSAFLSRYYQSAAVSSSDIISTLRSPAGGSAPSACDATPPPAGQNYQTVISNAPPAHF